MQRNSPRREKQPTQSLAEKITSIWYARHAATACYQISKMIRSRISTGFETLHKIVIRATFPIRPSPICRSLWLRNLRLRTYVCWKPSSGRELCQRSGQRHPCNGAGLQALYPHSTSRNLAGSIEAIYMYSFIED